MTRLKWFLSFLAGLLLMGGALFFFRSLVPREGKPEAVLPAQVVAPASSVVTASGTTTAVVESEDFRKGEPLKRVMDLYERESRRVGQVDQDPMATQKRLEVSARELTAEEIRWLEEQAMDPKSDTDARFFAVYLMGLSHKLESIEALGRIALSPIPPSKNERKTEEARALRASAVEGIGQSCKEHPEAAKDKQMEVVAVQRDEFLRDRANRGLYACQYGKSIEEQDKEALRKLRQKKK